MDACRCTICQAHRPTADDVTERPSDDAELAEAVERRLARTLA